jgi:hypothetical protein
METALGLILLILTGVAFMRPVQIEPRARSRVFWIRFKRAAFVYLIAFILALIGGFIKGFFSL